MIEINLIPDVKSELLKAQSLRNFIIFVSSVVSIVAIGIVVIIAGTVFVAQPLLMGSKDNEIKQTFSTLEGQENIKSTVTLQNQLNQIDNLHNSAPNTSRIIGQITPSIKSSGENEVTYSTIDYAPDTNTLTIEGQAVKGFSALEVFRKTISETQIIYRKDSKGKTCTVSDTLNDNSGCIKENLTNEVPQTLEQSLGDNEDGVKVLRFKVSIVLNEKALSSESKDFAVLPPGKKDVTDSKTQIPDDMFKARAKDEEN